MVTFSLSQRWISVVPKQIPTVTGIVLISSPESLLGLFSAKVMSGSTGLTQAAHVSRICPYSGFAGDVMGHVVFILEAMVEGTPLQNVLPSSADTYLSLST